MPRREDRKKLNIERPTLNDEWEKMKQNWDFRYEYQNDWTEKEMANQGLRSDIYNKKDSTSRNHLNDLNEPNELNDPNHLIDLNGI